MAGESVKVLIDIAVKGREHVKGAVSDIKEIDNTAKGATGGIGGLSRGLVAATGVIVGAAVAAKQLYGALKEGAQLQTVTQRFDKLSDSIGTTADTMLSKLRSATQGMISDMDLMSSASQIMSLKLADSEDQVVRLATVAGTLNWDMQQVILTFANMSTMRLDALGLSVEEVKSKAKELEAAGMSAQEAFKEAVILAGEARLDVGGVSESEKSFKQLEAAIANTKNELSLLLIEFAESTGLINAMSEAASRLSFERGLREAVEAGELTNAQFRTLIATMRDSGVAAAEFQMQQMASANSLSAMDGGLVANIESYRMWSGAVQTAANIAEQAMTGASNSIIADVMAADAVLMQTVNNWQANQAMALNNRQGWRARAAQNRARQADAAGPFAHLREGAQQATTAVGGYTAAVDEAAAAHQRMGDTFSSFVDQMKAREEAMAKGGDMTAFDDMIIGADGLVNINAANKALYEQAKAAGASAGELALLGVATGQLTEEQAKAALKAAILMEKIKQLAASVVSGDISIGDAVGGLGDFGAQLNEGAITGAAGGIEGLAQAAQAFATGEYEATMQADGTQAFGVFGSMEEWLKRVTGTFHTNIVVTTTGAAVEEETEPRGGRSIPVAPPITESNTERSRNRADVISGRSGGATYNVSVTNYIDGKESGRASLDDVTADKTRAALMSLGLGLR
jgi:hypothetical protein